MITLMLGYFFSILCIIFIAIAAYNYYTNNIIFKINIDLMDIIFFIFVAILLLTFSLPKEENPLECEKCKKGKLSYVDTINYSNGTTFYRYHCDNCDRLFRTEEWRGK